MQTMFKFGIKKKFDGSVYHLTEKQNKSDYYTFEIKARYYDDAIVLANDFTKTLLSFIKSNTVSKLYNFILENKTDAINDFSETKISSIFFHKQKDLFSKEEIEKLEYYHFIKKIETGYIISEKYKTNDIIQIKESIEYA